jgi:hypothetical protein
VLPLSFLGLAFTGIAVFSAAVSLATSVLKRLSNSALEQMG